MSLARVWPRLQDDSWIRWLAGLRLRYSREEMLVAPQRFAMQSMTDATLLAMVARILAALQELAVSEACWEVAGLEQDAEASTVEAALGVEGTLAAEAAAELEMAHAA